MPSRARTGSPTVASTTAASPIQSAFHRLGAPCMAFTLQDARHRARWLCRLEPASGALFASPARREARPSRPELSLRVRGGRAPPIDFCKQDSSRASTADVSITLSSGGEQAPRPRSGLIACRLRRAISRGRTGQGLARRCAVQRLRSAIARGEALPRPALPGHLLSLTHRGADLEGPAPRPRFLGGVSPVVGELLWSPASSATTLIAFATRVASRLTGEPANQTQGRLTPPPAKEETLRCTQGAFHR